uniref:Uncharacterized protein n=1 Tax=Mycena chlorophos TaxID=658473 RepID=A0ABQ0M2F9_MYCCL|nr:predicted protein [Mycena chlorophos]
MRSPPNARVVEVGVREPGSPPKLMLSPAEARSPILSLSDAVVFIYHAVYPSIKSRALSEAMNRFVISIATALPRLQLLILCQNYQPTLRLDSSVPQASLAPLLVLPSFSDSVFCHQEGGAELWYFPPTQEAPLYRNGVYPAPAPTLGLQPPHAPRPRTIPLPPLNFHPHIQPQQAFSRPRDAYPHNLLDDPDTMDFTALMRVLPAHSIPAHSTVFVLPTANRATPLFALPTGNAPTSAVAFVAQLQRLMRAPLTVDGYRLAGQAEAVRSYFLSRSKPGRERDAAVRRWNEFLDGRVSGSGPRGAVLLRGHTHMWGMWLDPAGNWILDVDVPAPAPARTF